MTENKTLPVYSKRKYTQDFYFAFMGGGSYTSVTCKCGRTHFSDEFAIDDDEDEQMKSRLEKYEKECPSAYFCHNGSVSHFSSNNESVVFACKCNYAGFLEGLIIEHSGSIINYLKSIAVTTKKEADAFSENVSSL